MPLNDVTFQTIQGGLGRLTAGEDHISALVFALTAPTAFASDKIRSYVDIKQVEADGITETDATYGIVHYHASEFFRQAPGSTLYLAFTIIFPDDLFAASAGKIRQVGVFFKNMADVQSIYQAAATSMAALNAPMQIVAGWEDTLALNLGTAPDQGLSNSPEVSVLLAGDGGAKGAGLASSLGKIVIPAVGAVLGAMAKAKVHESIAWVEKFNLSDGAELETIRLADGTDNPMESALDQLNTKRYLVFRKHIGISGTYLNDSHSATDAVNDFAYIENNRTMHKAKRLVRAALLPQLNAPLSVDPTTGKLAVGTVRFFETLGSNALNQMLSNNELSDFNVFVNPDQDVLATSLLTIQVKLVPRGVARAIVIQIGFSVTTEF